MTLFLNILAIVSIFILVTHHIKNIIDHIIRRSIKTRRYKLLICLSLFEFLIADVYIVYWVILHWKN